MSHFYGDLSGSRGTATRCGSRHSGITSHPRGWNLGVSTSGYTTLGGNDRFSVHLTDGSAGEKDQQQFAQVQRMEDGWLVILTRPDGTHEALTYS